MGDFPPVILAHALAASFALSVGLLQLLRRKRGDRAHRILGWSWVSAMAVVIVSSFFIQTLNGGFSWLHGLSILTAGTTTLALIAAHRHNVPSHRAAMIGTYLGLVGAFVGVVAVPSRRIPTFATGHPLEFAIWTAAILATSFALAVAVIRLAAAPVRR